MRTRRSLSAIALLGTLVGSPFALAQTKADCPKPEMVSGQIVGVDADQGKITLRASDGQTHEFSASKEVLHDKKVGDRLEITKRMPEGCK